MNLFILSEDPIEAAIFNCNTHCNKMFLEGVQMLTNCFPEHVLVEMPRTVKDTVRKYSHFNHPVSKWIRESRCNLQWCFDHVAKLESERLYRGMNPHFSSTAFNWICYHKSKMIDIPDKGLTPFASAIAKDTICRSKIWNFDKKTSSRTV